MITLGQVDFGSKRRATLNDVLITPEGALAFAHKSDPEAVQSFTTGLVSGANLISGSPILTLRNSLTSSVTGRGATSIGKGAIARKTLEES